MEWAFDTEADGEFEETLDSLATPNHNGGRGSDEVTLLVTDTDDLTDTTGVTIAVRTGRSRIDGSTRRGRSAR